MRIGFISTEVRAGGATRAMRRTMDALTQAGHETVLITLAEPSDGDRPAVRVFDQTSGPRARVNGVAHYFYNGRYVARNRTPLSDTPFWVPSVGLDIAPGVGALGLDVVNVHWTSYFLSVRSIEALMGLPTPVVFTLHDMSHFTGGCHYSAGCRRFESNCSPCPQLKHDPLNVPQGVLKRRRAAYEIGRPWAIGPSRWMTRAVIEGGAFEADRCVTIANALDLETFSPQARSSARRAFGLPQDGRVILFGAVDNREHRKGFDLLLEAMRRYLANASTDDRPVVILGIGSHLPELPLDGVRVVETGFIDDDLHLAQAYAASDVVVLASREDNLPNVMVEAMACGTPVAGFDIGGIGETITDGVDGALARPFDSEGLADGIRRVFLDADSGGDMRLQARRSAQHLASPQTHARRYIEVFEKAREAAGYAVPQGLRPHPWGWSPPSPQPVPGTADYFGGWPAEALIRARALLP